VPRVYEFRDRRIPIWPMRAGLPEHAEISSGNERGGGDGRRGREEEEKCSAELPGDLPRAKGHVIFHLSCYPRGELLRIIPWKKPARINGNFPFKMRNGRAELTVDIAGGRSALLPHTHTHTHTHTHIHAVPFRGPSSIESRK